MSKVVKAAKPADDTRRSFEWMVDENTTVKYYLGIPTSDQIRKADWHYSKIYNKALVEGVATEAEMMDILRQRKIYSPEYLEKLENLQIEIALKINELSLIEDEREKSDLAMVVRELRDKLYQWNQRITGPLSNTCERMAEDAKMEYLTSVAVQMEDGTPVWETYDEFVEEPQQKFSIKCRFEVLLWMQGLEPDFLDKTPENVALSEIADAQKGRREAKQLQAAAQEAETAADKAVADADEAVSKKKPRAKKA